ncbi:hypothetical protein O0I10_005350 [Lichtheimia ornata]|uniref:DUF202 domain-containing protein n=1 Tax=Lichtheimia ornata TaxID=688661 RepID=A0AAD7V433_9FUNG|nr:uncharacterized protein O0I10_005350 [Lichtheimia ornata]KAJ8658968.1 hypothetical protein O0I10_005350 [Lichtheimia ornata]
MASSSAAGPSHSQTIAPHTEFFPDIALVLPNKGSMARDMLANERNFLTFFKLSCTLTVLGFTILLKFRFPSGGSTDDDDGDWADNSVTEPIGYCFVAIGLTCLFVGVRKYFMTQLQLAKQVSFLPQGKIAFGAVITIFFLACIVMVLASLNSDLFVSPNK